MCSHNQFATEVISKKWSWLPHVRSPFSKQTSCQTDNINTLKYVFDILSFFWNFSNFFAQDLGIQITRCWRIISTGGFIQRRSVHAPGGEGSQTSHGDWSFWKSPHWSSGKNIFQNFQFFGFPMFCFRGVYMAMLNFRKGTKATTSLGSQKERTLLCNQLFGEVNHFVSMVPYTSTYSISKDHKHSVYLPLKHFCIVFILEPLGPCDYPIILESQLGPTFHVGSEMIPVPSGPKTPFRPRPSTKEGRPTQKANAQLEPITTHRTKDWESRTLMKTPLFNDHFRGQRTL